MVTLSGVVKNKISKTDLPFVNVVLKTETDSMFISGTITNERGLFSIANINSGSYIVELSFIGYRSQVQPVLVRKNIFTIFTRRWNKKIHSEW